MRRYDRLMAVRVPRELGELIEKAALATDGSASEILRVGAEWTAREVLAGRVPVSKGREGRG